MNTIECGKYDKNGVTYTYIGDYAYIDTDIMRIFERARNGLFLLTAYSPLAELSDNYGAHMRLQSLAEEAGLRYINIASQHSCKSVCSQYLALPCPDDKTVQFEANVRSLLAQCEIRLYMRYAIKKPERVELISRDANGLETVIFEDGLCMEALIKQCCRLAQKSDSLISFGRRCPMSTLQAMSFYREGSPEIMD